MLALPLIWVACSLAAYVYSHQQNIPLDLAFRALPAFLLEATFYFVLGKESWRARLEKLPAAGIALAMTAAAAAPYCAASLALGFFSWQGLAWTAGIAAIASFWYVLLPHRAATDLLFLLLLAVVTIQSGARSVYVVPAPRLRIDILGELMWIRTGAFALLSVRRVKNVGFGFWPKRGEWKIGLSYFALLVPVAAVAAWAIGFATPHLPPPGWERITILALGTFFGILWVVGLGEEFFFRGLLQQWIGEWFHNQWLGLAGASVLFGTAHLWLRKFPNWRFALLAAVAGVFYGLAFRHARSIRASMVTHALTVTTWRLFFS